MKQLRYFLKLRGNPRKSRAELDRLQSEGLRRILLSAYRNTEYYRHLFDDHGIDPNTVTPGTISQIPVQTKRMLRDAGQAVHSRLYGDDDVVVENTGGSTGKPLQVRVSRDAIAVSRAAKLRTYVEHGYRLSQKICSFLFHGPRTKFYHRLGIHRTYSIAPFMAIEDAIAYLQEHNPHVFDGYPSRIASFARYVRKNGIRGITPVLVFANSETLQEKDRETIREVFADPVNVYVSYEFKVIAWECEARNGLHINEDLMLVEIVDPDTGEPVPNGVTGEVVITGFCNEAMPFIRYNTEDVGVISGSPCSCGRSFILLKDLFGRVSDFIVLPSGVRVLGQAYITSALGTVGIFHKIACYQARQREDGSIDLALDAEDLSEADIGALQDELAKGLETTEIRIQPASAIKLTKRGKYRVFKSALS